METNKIMSNNDPECVTFQMQLCGEVLKKITDRQKEYKQQTGRSLSKRQAIIQFVLGK